MQKRRVFVFLRGGDDTFSREKPRGRRLTSVTVQIIEKRFMAPRDLPTCLEAAPWSRGAVARASPAEKHEWMPGTGPVDPDRSRDPHAGNTARSSWARSPCIAR